jgi:hypothetical protein
MMKTMRLAATAASFAVALNSVSALAEGPRASSGNAILQTADEPSATMQVERRPHYEWQYHYVGHHGRVEGYWALVP